MAIYLRLRIQMRLSDFSKIFKTRQRQPEHLISFIHTVVSDCKWFVNKPSINLLSNRSISFDRTGFRLQKLSNKIFWRDLALLPEISWSPTLVQCYERHENRRENTGSICFHSLFFLLCFAFHSLFRIRFEAHCPQFDPTQRSLNSLANRKHR